MVATVPFIISLHWQDIEGSIDIQRIVTIATGTC